MKRLEQEIMDGWEFALIKCEPIQKSDKGTTYNVGEKNCDMPEGLIYQNVNLPHDWAVNAPFRVDMEQGAAQGYRDRWGVGWYRKKLSGIGQEPESQVILEFDGIYENSTVWVNGICMGGHKYGYSAFCLSVTEAWHTGENEIVVKVDNSVAPVDRWYSGCGIYRTVKLVFLNERHLTPWEVNVQSKIRESIGKEKEGDKLIKRGGIQAYVSVDTGQKGDVYGTLEELGIIGNNVYSRTAEEQEGENKRKFTACSQDGTLLFEVPSPLLWSAEKPNLYALTISLLDRGKNITLDEITLQIGIREVIMDVEKGMLVNGFPVKLKGICVHQDVGCAGVAVRPELWRQRLVGIKELGCNAIRISPHVQSTEFLKLCDELGFYVYEDCFDKWTGGLYGRYFQTEWKSDMEAMIKRDRNHPSIIIWGIGNEVENQGQESMLRLLRLLKEYAVNLDGTRPITCSMNPHFKRESNMNVAEVKDIQKFVDEVSDTEIDNMEERLERIKRIGEIVDIISCNYQEQWYEKIHERIPNKLILGTEVYGYFIGHSEQMQNFTEQNPSLVPYSKKYCIGSFIWAGFDYLGESMGYPSKGWCGALIRTNNERRPLAYIMQSYWSKKPMVHFSVMDYSLQDEAVKEHWDYPKYVDHWYFPQFDKMVVPYMIVSNCEEVRLFLNGKRFFISNAKDCPNHVIRGFLPWQPGKVEVIGINDDKMVCHYSTITPGPAVKLEFDQEQYNMYRGQRQVLLTARAKDKEGNIHFRESSKVFFRVEGPARIVGVDNGDLMGEEPYGGTSVHLYCGCASVLIEMEQEQRVVVGVYGNGLYGSRIVILPWKQNQTKSIFQNYV